MADVYEHQCLVNEQSSAKKLEAVFGPNEAALTRLYEVAETRGAARAAVAGGYDFERTQMCGEFLALFFKLGFEQSEEWEPLVHTLNESPLLPEFYEPIRRRELPNDFVDKQHLMEAVSCGQRWKIE